MSCQAAGRRSGGLGTGAPRSDGVELRLHFKHAALGREQKLKKETILEMTK